MQVSTQKQLRQFVESIERLIEEQKALGGDIKDKMAEAKAVGFDPKIIRKVLAIRRKSKAEHDEEEALIASYLHGLGMAGTPLGEYAERQPEAVN